MTQLQPIPESRGEIVSAKPNMAQLFEIAAQHGKEGAETMAALVGLQERMEDRAARKEFNTAMAAFQSECPTIPHSRMGVHATYTEFDFLCEFIQPLCEKHGFSYSFDSEAAEGRQRTTCIVSHIGGHDKQSHFSATVEKHTRSTAPQLDATALKYGQRLSLTLAFGLRTGKEDKSGQPTDDDGQGSGGQPVSEEQARIIGEWCQDLGGDTELKLLAWVRQTFPSVKTIEQIPERNFEKCVAALKQKKGGQK